MNGLARLGELDEKHREFVAVCETSAPLLRTAGDRGGATHHDDLLKPGEGRAVISAMTPADVGPGGSVDGFCGW